jgi:hypothetical protein
MDEQYNEILNVKKSIQDSLKILPKNTKQIALHGGIQGRQLNRQIKDVKNYLNSNLDIIENYQKEVERKSLSMKNGVNVNNIIQKDIQGTNMNNLKLNIDNKRYNKVMASFKNRY